MTRPFRSVSRQRCCGSLRVAAERGSARDKAAAVQGLAQLSAGDRRAQGVGAAIRPAVAALTRVPWFAPFGVAAAGRFVATVVGQVTTYLDDDVVRRAAQRRVLHLIDSETRLVIGNSLGSVVAYEALFHTAQPLALITLGSPSASGR